MVARGYREKGLYKSFNRQKEMVCTGMETGRFEEFRSSFEDMIEGLVRGEGVRVVESGDGARSEDVRVVESGDGARSEGVRMVEGGDGARSEGVRMVEGGDGARSEGVRMVEGGEGARSEGVRVVEGGDGDKVRSEKSSKTDSESQSSEGSVSDSSDDSSSSTNQNPAESHMTVAEATEAARLANQISELDVYDPSFPETTGLCTLSLFCEIVRMKERLLVAQLLQEVGHVTGHVTSRDVM